MATVKLDGATIHNWNDFHAQCRQAFAFPDFYGDNLDAWMDCLSYLRDDDGMTRFVLKDKEVLTIEVLHSQQLRKQVPDMIEELTFCIAVLNESYTDLGEQEALRLVLR